MNVALTTHVTEVLGKGQLYGYLTGRGDYRYVSPYADMPTDIEVVVLGIEAYYLAGHPEIVPLFKDTVLQLSHDPLDGWLTAYYCREYLWLVEKKQTIQDKDAHTFVESALTNLLPLKDGLIQRKEFMGEGREDGLWGAVLKMIKLTIDTYRDVRLDMTRF